MQSFVDKLPHLIVYEDSKHVKHKGQAALEHQFAEVNKCYTKGGKARDDIKALAVQNFKLFWWCCSPEMLKLCDDVEKHIRAKHGAAGGEAAEEEEGGGGGAASSSSTAPVAKKAKLDSAAALRAKVRASMGAF